MNRSRFPKRGVSRLVGVRWRPRYADVVPTLPLSLELAVTPDARQRGLMSRLAFAPGTDGMLFVFKPPATGPFWNPQTLLPLDVAYVDAEQRLFAILPMRTIVESRGVVETYAPPAPYLAALELLRGRLTAARVPLGARLEIYEAAGGRARGALVW